MTYFDAEGASVEYLLGQARLQGVRCERMFVPAPTVQHEQTRLYQTPCLGGAMAIRNEKCLIQTYKHARSLALILDSR